MFDGSHRTNKREINLAGASASSRSSRRAHLDVARKQRLERARAKARANGARCLQRCWRGSRGRRAAAAALGARYRDAMRCLSDGAGSSSSNNDKQKISRAASLLAFRMSPALLPFFASDRPANSVASPGKKKWGAEDDGAEKCLRGDVMSLRNSLGGVRAEVSEQVISPAASRRIVSVVLVLLRQSLRAGRGVEREGNGSLVDLLDYLLQFTSPQNAGWWTKDGGTLWTHRPSDHYMDVLRDGQVKEDGADPNGWAINLFLCFRDFASGPADEGGGWPMDTDGADGGGEAQAKTLLKWCCRVIVGLEALDRQRPQRTPPPAYPLMYQQGLALLASVLFSSCRLGGEPWVDECVNGCLARLGQCARGNAPPPLTSWRPILIHFLSAAMNDLSVPSAPSRDNVTGSADRRVVPGLIPSFSPNSVPSENRWREALRDTLSSREFIIANQVLSQANEAQTQPQHKVLLTYAIPTILQYTLRNQPDLAILASFAARGEDVASWVAGRDAQKLGTAGADAVATAAAAAAYGGEDAEEASDDDEQYALPKQHNKPVRCETMADTSGRHSRADLQTLPKLDALYQTGTLRAKAATANRLRGYGDRAYLLVSLAEKIGKGEWIQQLGNTLFSFTEQQPSLSSLLPLLAPLSLPSWQIQAQVAYTGALATVMTTCSGIKAGRNAASPLLARLAFHDPFLYGLWERSSRTVSLLMPQSFPSKTMDSSALASAYENFSSFCDVFSHHLLALNDDDFLKRYHHPAQHGHTPQATGSKDRIVAKDLVLAVRNILNDLYWVRPVLASDLTNTRNDSESILRFQRARLLLSGTKLWNSLYERWCRLYRVVRFCDEDCWWFPHLASRGRHDNNPIVQSQVTTLADQTDEMDDSSVESANMQDADEGGDALASTFRDPKVARVLTYIPQAMPFNRRVNLFNALLESDKMKTQDDTASLRQMIMNLEEGEEAEISGRERVKIRRDELYIDSKQSLNRLGRRLRKKVQVTFVNTHGQEEAGIDGGGVFKEFIDDLIKDAFLPQTVREEDGRGGRDNPPESHPDFFSVTPLQTLKVNTSLDEKDSILSNYEFLGRVLGKAIYESILVEPQFCLPFLNKLLGKSNSLDDLKNLDPEYYRNLKSLRHMSAQQINDLGITFELHDSATTTIELMPGGSSIPVTKNNVIQYIHLVSHQKMNVRGSRQTSGFLNGFRDIIPAQWVRIFSAYELQKLISGDDAVKGIDVEGMKSAMRYSGGLHPSQPIVQWLWKVVMEMTPDQQRKFLKFMTSCSRQPLLGFGSMVPAPCIQQTRLREDDNGNGVAEGLGIGNIRLPTSSTCMNLLKLPKYTSLEMLREKLLYAIESASGFELS